MNCSICNINPKHYTNGLCKPCRTAYNKQWYLDNKEKQKLVATRNNIKYALRANEIINKFKDKPCADCNVAYPSHIMDCDHVSGVKLNDVSKMKKGNIEALIAELAKCEVVCSNCHRDRTFKRLNAVLV